MTRIRIQLLGHLSKYHSRRFLHKPGILFVSMKPQTPEKEIIHNTRSSVATAFIRITEVTDGSDYKNRYFLESLNEDDLDEVLWMPDTIPYQVSSLPSVGQEGLTLDSNLYDHVA